MVDGVFKLLVNLFGSGKRGRKRREESKELINESKAD
jgi:hypothetical protein